MKSIFKIKKYRDEEKLDLFFEGKFITSKEVLDFLPELTKNFLYNLNNYKKNGRKSKYMINKYCKIEIIKITNNKNGLKEFRFNC